MNQLARFAGILTLTGAGLIGISSGPGVLAESGGSEAREDADPVPERLTHEMADAMRAEQAELEKLLAALALRAETYEASQLRFVCEETLIRSSFKTGSGRLSDQDVGRFDYLLGRTSSGEIVERRRPLEKKGSSRWKDLKLSHPQPYRWTLLFSRHNQQLFNYRLAGQEVVHFRLVTVIEFDAILPFTDGTDITQWSGTAYIDAESLDVLRVEAAPPGQQIRLEAATRDYHQAFRLMGIPLRRRPRVHVHEVDLTYQKDGLRLPTLVMTQRYTATNIEERSLHKQVMQIFTDYQLFQVETDEKLREIRDSASP